MFNPLRTLTGRMVLVTVVAVVISYAAAFTIFANERGAALRRAAETAIIERVAFTAERLREAPPERRAQVAAGIRDYAVRYSIAREPGMEASLPASAGARIATALSERLAGAEVHARTRVVEGPSRRWRRRDFEEGGPPPGEGRRGEGRRRERGGERGRGGEEGPIVRSTEVNVAVQLTQGSWLIARARMPAPRPAPLGVLIAGLVSVVAVGIGAALVSRQIGRPLAQLAGAARALGAGETNVAAPVAAPRMCGAPRPRSTPWPNGSAASSTASVKCCGRSATISEHPSPR